jgi:exopolyphosphatase/guanosine-5'-triphosphate,3'-diphosphate pyrophosphatase
LLVVETQAGRGWRILEEAQTVTRLAEGLAETGRLGEVPAARTARVVAQYAARAAGHRAEKLVIVATSAVREASNGRDFARHVSDLAGHPVRVVPGDAEARLALRGVMYGFARRAEGEPSQKNPKLADWKSGTPTVAGTLLLFDIGGGSTEFIRARDGVLQAAVSLRLGVVPLVEQFRDYEGVARHVRARLEAEVPPGIARPTPDLLVGTAGTVTTVAALDLGLERYDAARVQGHRLRRAAVERELARLLPLTLAERASLPCLEPGRADVIVPGIAILLETMTLTGAESLVVSDDGLREGILIETLCG